jgi:hypothetical protein
MEQGDRSIELHLRFSRAGDGKINRAKRVAGMLLDLAPRFVGPAPKHEGTDSEAQEETAKAIFPELTRFPGRDRGFHLIPHNSSFNLEMLRPAYLLSLPAVVGEGFWSSAASPG